MDVSAHHETILLPLQIQLCARIGFDLGNRRLRLSVIEKFSYCNAFSVESKNESDRNLVDHVNVIFIL